MTEMDGRVERVLGGLREAEVPAGMEERVLRAVRARASERVREHGWRTAWLRGMGAYGIAAVALLAIVVMVGLMGRWTGRRSAVTEKSVVTVGSSPAARATAALQDSVVRPVARRRSRAVDNTRVAVVRSGEVKEASALTVSFPAPPLPLTEQERLLLRVVHGRDPVQMAMLDGVSSFEKLAEERAEFQRYFEVTPKKTALETKVELTNKREEK